MTRLPILALLVASTLVAVPLAQLSSPAVVLVTLDGARIEELFGGLDAAIVASQLRRRLPATQTDV